MKRLALLAATCYLLAGNSAGRAQATYTVYGQGNGSCGQWVEANKHGRDAERDIWVVGFVSGAAFAASPPLRTTDAQAIAASVDKYCAAHPLDSIAKASGALVQELQKR
jgi:hypothetical protein